MKKAVDKNKGESFILEKLLRDSPEDYQSVLDLFPGMFHVNDAKDFSVIHANSLVNEKFGLTSEEIREMGTEFLYKFIHDDTRKYEVPKLIEFYNKTDGKDTYVFFQKGKFPGTKEYVTILTVTKALPEYGVYVTNSNILPELGEAAHKLERVTKEQQFIRINFKKFRSLTNREIEILTMLAEGFNNPEIADKLIISRRTVEQHRRNINKKLGIKRYKELFQFAQAFDLI